MPHPKKIKQSKINIKKNNFKARSTSNGEKISKNIHS